MDDGALQSPETTSEPNIESMLFEACRLEDL